MSARPRAIPCPSVWLALVVVLGCLGVGTGASAAPREPAPAIRDRGETTSLLQALSAARSALSSAAGSRARLLDGLIADLRDGDRPGRALARHARVRSFTEVLLTGYYEPMLQARRRPQGPFRHPLYRPPRGARAQLSRKDIDGGGLTGKGLELFWLADPIESFFLHVQGSGRLELGDGTIVRVGYAGNNGQPYHSIGAELLSRGVLRAPEATAPAIKRWLRAHPQTALEVLQTNPRYVFFRELDVPPGKGPLGAMGAELVPYRSVAADPSVAPPGSVGFLRADLPDGTRFERVVVAMDTGAAIDGASRLDLFVGSGPEAERLAGELRSPGDLTWFEPR